MNAADLIARAAIRDLAYRVAEIAASDEQAYRRRLWRDVHSLRLPERPPVICHPDPFCWDEILPRTDLISDNPTFAGVEYELRKMLYKHEVGDDTVIEPWWPVHAVFRMEGEHLWGLPIGYTHSGEAHGAWHYVHPIQEVSDLTRVVPPRFTYDAQATEDAASQMHELLGDLLPIRRMGTIPIYPAWLHGWASQLCGVQELLLHMMDRPAWVHELMAILRDGVLDVMDQAEASGALTLNSTGTMPCDDLPLPGYDGERARLCDLWGRGESQEFQAVSPRQFEEFLLRYQMPLLTRFGLSYYGCCEDLTNKIDLVLSIPNLRKFVCSPWTNLKTLVAALGDRYCVEWRQKATDVVFATDMAPIREHLRRGLEVAKGTPIHIVLQELETVNGDMRRLHDWTAMAIEVGEAAA
jgi:hypothetical protein